MNRPAILFCACLLFIPTFQRCVLAADPPAGTRPADSVSNAGLKSPDGQITVSFSLEAAGLPHYAVARGGKPVLAESRLGLIRDDADFSTGLTLVSASPVEPVEDRYEILTAKRRLNNYRANRQVFHLATKGGAKMDIVFQVSNDGVAFRYVFPEAAAGAPRSIKEEVTSYRFLPETKAWLQPMQVAKTGYGNSNPAYEEPYEKEIPVGTPSALKAGWVYPALFHSGDTWIVVSEGMLPAGWCATRLRHESPDGEYSIGFPDGRETINGEPVNPAVKSPSISPWRLIAVGDLKTVAESTLGTDLADKQKIPTERWMEPGKAAWSWPLLGDGSAKFDTQKQFIDYAADMGWRYCLVDAWWDRQIGYDKMKELADYARTKNVRMLLWYNSAGAWNQVKQTPRDRLLTHESRSQEFARLKAMGIAGLKIDFFGGDGRAVIDYYRDILEDAAPYGLLINFHGATLPRGWQRAYPHLMTAEAIKGEEAITFGQKNADAEPGHAAMLPFTRNLFDPMDFTPVVLDKLPNGKQRRTTGAFELALSVIFTSGVQHYAETPAGMAKVPAFVKDFMKRVPSIWEDTKFLDGYPGKLAVLARAGGGHWYVAGINGEPTEKKTTLDLGFLPAGASGTLITDGANGTFEQRAIKLDASKKLEVTLQPNGGFVLTF